MDLNPELLVQRSGTLSLLSATAEEVSRLVAAPECNITRAVRVIESDRELHYRLLVLVNSPLFGFPTSVTTVGRAITILGPRDLCDLIVAAAVINTFKRLSDQTDPNYRFWERALYGAVTARLVAEHRHEPHLERFFVAGLLHDVGSIVLHLAVPNLYAQSIKLAVLKGITRCEAEKRLIGVDHTDVGGALAHGWGLAENLSAAVADHHAPLTSRYPLEASITHVADYVADRAATDAPTDQQIDRQIWDCIAVPPSLLDERSADIKARVSALRDTLLPQIQAA